MKSKHLPLLALSCIALLALWVFVRPRKMTKPLDVMVPTEATEAHSALERRESKSGRNQGAKQQDAAGFVYQLSPVSIDANSNIMRSNHDVAGRFRLVGDANSCKIVDSQENTVKELGPNPHVNTITSKCIVSPNGKDILINYGADAAYDVLESASSLLFTLPQQPPGKNKLGFASWHWIDSNTLIGLSGDEQEERTPGIEGEENGVKQSRLYLYDWNKKQLAEALLPIGSLTRLFSILDVDSSGNVHLIGDSSNGTQPSDLGWFVVKPK